MSDENYVKYLRMVGLRAEIFETGTPHLPMRPRGSKNMALYIAYIVKLFVSPYKKAG
jgi:hypothetical protein